MDEQFTRAELLTSEALAEIIVRRTQIKADWLERVCVGTTSARLEILFFIFKYGPVTKQQLVLLKKEDGTPLFSRKTIERALFAYEASGAIKERDFKYSVQE